MRLKSVTTINTLLLVAVCLALATTLWWSERALERPYLLMARYVELSQQFQHRLAENIQAYLGSGDALRHSETMQALDALAQGVDTLPEPFADRLRPSLAQLDDFAGSDLLAAGKLAGDPQGLLLQAERELASIIDQLERYADQSDKPEADAYAAPLLSAARHLLRLSHARDKLVSSGRDELASEVEQQLQSLGREAARLQDLPLLGIATEAVASTPSFADLLELDSASEQKASEDTGIALKRELSSLLNRYPAELERTLSLIRERQALALRSMQKVNALQQALTELEPEIRAERARIQAEVRLAQASIISLILLIALAIDRLQRRLTRALAKLAPALSSWAQGDFQEVAKLDSGISEMADIETSLNRLRGYLLQLIGTLRQHAQAVAGSSHDLAQMSTSLHEAALRQTDETGEIRDALESLEATIQQVAEGAQSTAETSRDAGQVISQGQQVIGQSLEGLQTLVGEVEGNAQAIERLAEETSTIGGVLTVIRSIAEQTNLLALNAAIEAARAGDHGRGFAVVADEVRSLAQRTTGATAEIQQLIEALQLAARQSVEAMRNEVEHARSTASEAETAELALGQIVSIIADIGQMAERIAQTTSQQSAAVSEIRRHGDRIHQLGDTNLAHISRGREQSRDMLQLGEELTQVTAAFRL